MIEHEPLRKGHQMAKNTGRPRDRKNSCSDLRDMYREFGKEGDKKFLSGDREGGAYESWAQAGAVFADAKHVGCKWAQ
jgi:hypothetical protein